MFFKLSEELFLINWLLWIIHGVAQFTKAVNSEVSAITIAMLIYVAGNHFSIRLSGEVHMADRISKEQPQRFMNRKLTQAQVARGK
jgi:hypothetical protein